MQYYLISLKLFVLFLCQLPTQAQSGTITGMVTANGAGVGFASVVLHHTSYAAVADSTGSFSIKDVPVGTYTLLATATGYAPFIQKINVTAGELHLPVHLLAVNNSLDAVVVTGTLKEVKRMESPVPVEVYTPQFFRKNPTPNIFDALQQINGVRPQLNCNICNTGDIHINGLEGPYTMVLIDGMPIVSSLATVYGLSGIPNSLVERIEIVKGPSSSLYGSEAVGGLINIITKKPEAAPLLSADVFGTTWQEYNADIGLKLKAGEKATALTGINYYNFNQIADKNKDGFTDVTLQHRISLFQKWNIQRRHSRLWSAAVRYFYEDRWGGETHWTKRERGGNNVYGESIYTARWEAISNYQLPTKEKLMLSFSYNSHNQDSRYGSIPYIAQQRIAFTQLTWDKTYKQHDVLAGAALRYTSYDDNTPATAGMMSGQNKPDNIWLPGIFVQDEIAVSPKSKLLLGARYDKHSVHGNIFTPRMAFKYSLDADNIIRLNAGTGFRVVNLFTEDHAALTGARTVVIEETLQPEKSYNVNLNYMAKWHLQNHTFIGLDATAWYTRFNNRIIADFETHPDKILYNNLNGFAVSKGVSLNMDVALPQGLKITAGATVQEVATINGGIKKQQMLTERFSGTWAVTYKPKALPFSFDYTGNVYGPMRLPLLGELDPRQPLSPTWSLQNIQVTYKGKKALEIYGGIKNLLNFTPARNNPFLIARASDPFDKDVEYIADGKVKPTPANPYALTFDPTYIYAPNQGRRGFLGIRLSIP